MALDEKWFRVRKDVVKLPNGKVMDDYFLWLSGDIAIVVPVTEDNKLILVKQYKYGADKEMIEFPAGFIDNNESSEDAARRELEEETGYVAEKIELFAECEVNATKAIGRVFYYIAKNVKKKGITKQDISEDIETLVVSVEEVIEMIERGEIRTGDSIAAFFLAMKKLNML